MPGANLRQIMKETPRALEVVAHDDKDQPPIGRKKLSPAKVREKRGSYLAEVLSGKRPLDDEAADVIRSYLDDFHARTPR